MSGRIILGLVSREFPVKSQNSLNLWGRLNYRSYSTTQKVKWTKPESMDNIMSFKDFKENHIESLESFKKSPLVKAVCGNDVEKVSKAYKRFCFSQYALYKRRAYGGNPSLMN